MDLPSERPPVASHRESGDMLRLLMPRVAVDVAPLQQFAMAAKVGSTFKGGRPIRRAIFRSEEIDKAIDGNKDRQDSMNDTAILTPRITARIGLAKVQTCPLHATYNVEVRILLLGPLRHGCQFFVLAN
jgi:hypothetical protein